MFSFCHLGGGGGGDDVAGLCGNCGTSISTLLAVRAFSKTPWNGIGFGRESGSVLRCWRPRLQPPSQRRASCSNQRRQQCQLSGRRRSKPFSPCQPIWPPSRPPPQPSERAKGLHRRQSNPEIQLRRCCALLDGAQAADSNGKWAPTELFRNPAAPPSRVKCSAKVLPARRAQQPHSSRQ